MGYFLQAPPPIVKILCMPLRNTKNMYAITDCPKIYRRCSTGLRYILGHSVHVKESLTGIDWIESCS